MWLVTALSVKPIERKGPKTDPSMLDGHVNDPASYGRNRKITCQWVIARKCSRLSTIFTFTSSKGWSIDQELKPVMGQRGSGILDDTGMD